MSTPTIPASYRIFFTTIDPLLALTGFISALFVPTAIVGTHLPVSGQEPPAETTFLLQTLAGFYLALLVLEVYLLRVRPHDLTIWRALEFSLLLTDFFLVGATAKWLGAEGGLNPLFWGLGEVGAIALTAGLGVIRVLFIIGVGMRSGTGVKSA
ncbi:hypothetical protein LTR62_001550 [Meristemomyces frigidus]|uniref:DUF7704 domain-containing protein n=1 Tax=Meristemomyces frigidus TaxID=1508187 RepID=A0AAN7TNM5_9PEZI|nr:hypothetical protein LTR62_001550 [Meristemomyces frigidus]